MEGLKQSALQEIFKVGGGRTDGITENIKLIVHKKVCIIVCSIIVVL